jgi:hypothetical protein
MRITSTICRRLDPGCTEHADRGRVVKADIPCFLGGGRRGFNPRQLRRAVHVRTWFAHSELPNPEISPCYWFAKGKRYEDAY